MNTFFQLENYQFNLPEELIAQYPCPRRDESRLLVVDRKTGDIREEQFPFVRELLQEGDSLVLNNTKVIPARLYGKRESGGQVELLLLKPRADNCWECMARPGRKLKLGTKIIFSPSFHGVVQDCLPNGHRLIRFSSELSFMEALEQHGQMPLPHYIERSEENPLDEERYQTVFAQNPGAVAAPTAGLHFTKEILADLKIKGVQEHQLTLHVGPGTFRPVQTDDIREHDMHWEAFEIDSATAEALNKRPKGSRQICVGTTCCRSLESAADESGRIQATCRETQLFIYPGYQFRYVQSLLTNFHLPGSTLFMLVCALAGYDLAHEAYSKAIEKRFRFYSYGDAMLIL